MPTTAAPSTFVPTDMPLVSVPPTATPLPSPAPTATAAPTTTLTLACDSATSWVASEDLAREDARAASGMYTKDAIRASAWDQVDTLPDLFQAVYGAVGVECSYVNSQIVDEEAVPYVVETGSADAPYVCFPLPEPTAAPSLVPRPDSLDAMPSTYFGHYARRRRRGY